MNAPQISVFLENRPGRLAHLLQVLAGAGVNMRALSVADSADFGIVRLIVDDADAAMEAIRAGGMTARATQVLRVEVPDEPGALERIVVEPLAEAGVNIAVDVRKGIDETQAENRPIYQLHSLSDNGGLVSQARTVTDDR